jgi:hypothetical protein
LHRLQGFGKPVSGSIDSFFPLQFGHGIGGTSGGIGSRILRLELLCIERIGRDENSVANHFHRHCPWMLADSPFHGAISDIITGESSSLIVAFPSLLEF